MAAVDAPTGTAPPDVASDLRALSERYAAAVDRRDADLFVAGFAPDAALVVHRPGEAPERGARLTGHAELRSVTDNLGRYARTMHFLGQSVYDVHGDGDEATGEVYCVAHHLRHREDGATDGVMYIRYHDRYRHTRDGWAFAARHVWCDWTETRPVGGAPASTAPSGTPA